MFKFKFLKLIKKINILINCRKDFSIPRHKPILMVDQNGTDILLKYFINDDFNIINTRGESINVWSLIRSFLSFNFTFRGYVNAYIKFTKPKIAITFIDNTILFHRIKRDNPEIITISIQNGNRERKPLSLANEKNVVDYMLVFNHKEGKRNLDYLKGKYLAIGSFKLIYISKKILAENNRKKKKEYVFISQFRSCYLDNIELAGPDLYEPEIRILPMILSYSSAQKIPFVILSCSNNLNDYDREYIFYRDILGYDNGWILKRKLDTFSNYFSIKNSDLVISIDSTLGYEGVVMGKRSAIFGARFEFTTDKAWYCNLGGGELNKKGEFWTDETTKQEFERVMDFALNSKELIWKSTVNKYKEYIMNYDPGNSIFIDLLKKLNVSFKNDY
jgi:surface carbohydrate biosynthesis protein